MYFLNTATDPTWGVSETNQLPSQDVIQALAFGQLCVPFGAQDPSTPPRICAVLPFTYQVHSPNTAGFESSD